MKFVSWNVNGIRAIVKKGFIDTIASLTPDILCLQEVKATRDQAPNELYDFAEGEGYEIYWSSAEKKGYSGVAILSRVKVSSWKTLMDGTDSERFEGEGRLIELTCPSFTLFNVYFPNGGRSEERLRYKMDFYETFLALVERRLSEGKHIVVCGDVNTAHREIDLARPKANEAVSGFLPSEREWIDRIIAVGMVDVYRHLNPVKVEYTWWDMVTRARERNVGWRIDYFFISHSLLDRVEVADIHGHILGSDHCPISIELAIPN